MTVRNGGVRHGARSRAVAAPPVIAPMSTGTVIPSFELGFQGQQPNPPFSGYNMWFDYEVGDVEITDGTGYDHIDAAGGFAFRVTVDEPALWQITVSLTGPSTTMAFNTHGSWNHMYNFQMGEYTSMGNGEMYQHTFVLGFYGLETIVRGVFYAEVGEEVPNWYGSVVGQYVRPSERFTSPT